MSVLTNDIRAEVKSCLDKIAAKRAAKLTITNDARAKALGVYFDSKGNIHFPKRKHADQRSGAVRTSFPSNNA